jgi:hypothetical protein
MADYSKTTDFAIKDGLASGNPSKVIKGTEHDTEYNNIATAIASKSDVVSTYWRTNILGTVGQSAGVPTGAIIQTGTNSNGTFVKLADGTMICRTSFSTTNPVNTAIGSIFKSSSEESWTFPAVFIATPSLTGFVISGTANSWVGLGANATGGGTSTLFVVMSAASQTAPTTVISLMAVGTWF